MPRPVRPLNAKQEGFIRAEARGIPHDKILQEFFDVTDLTDKKAVSAAESRMSRLRMRPEYDKIWADELKRTLRKHVPSAIGTLMSQSKNGSNDWLANKAANDCITLANRVGIIANEEESEITLRFEGMPKLGSPDAAEDV